MIKNKKGQISSIIYFAGIVLVLIFLAPVLMKLVLSVSQPFGEAMATIDQTNKSVDAVNYTEGKFTGMFDWILMFFFIFNVILVLVTAFLVDVHPAFLVVYVIGVFFLVVFAPMVLDAIDTIWTAPQFSVGDDNVVQYLPLMNFLRENFIWVILGVIVLSGIVMFGKYRLGSANQQQGGGNYY